MCAFSPPFTCSFATPDGVTPELYQIPETLPDEVLEKMGAPPKDDTIPVLDDVQLLAEADGILFGFPTRFGTTSAQVSAFWDRTGGLWQAGALVGKPVGVFTSTANVGGGQENTISSTISRFVHHGMIFVPIGYSTPLLMDNSEPRGGSPWGAGTITLGDGSRMPSELELGIAKHQGQHFASIVLRLA